MRFGWLDKTLPQTQTYRKVIAELKAALWIGDADCLRARM